MTTVLIILLAYPIANVVLNHLAMGMMCYIHRMDDDFIQTILYGQMSLKYVFHPYWIKAFYWMMRLTTATVVCMVRGRWYL